MSESDRLWEMVFQAIESDDRAQLEEAIRGGFQINLSRNREYTELHHAAQKGRTRMLAPLLPVSPPAILDVFDYAHASPLIYAVREGHLDTAAELIRLGSDVNAHDEEEIGDTALREAIDGEHSSAEMVELLLRAGSDPTIPGWMQSNALDRATIRWEKRRDRESERILRLCEQHARK